MAHQNAFLTAVLGPTNTGKTHLAVERMCGHSSGMMGFPLRLLAREIYDRVVKIKGEGQVALITGEEKIEPPGARYYCCTVESMPIEREFAFVAVDEAQLAADPERGHIFTDRMLHARGFAETMILGSESLAPLIRKLLPDAEIISRPRFSTLSYGGAKKLSRLPKRSAVVAFSVEQVYAMAETLRRLRGGCAVVMGALSPRTRNAQVAMFQSGEVDYIVATDAIGMGLNLDVRHVAFAALGKFDGVRRRRLTVAEMAQIAGRAGRHQTDGTFGTLSGEAPEMTAEEILAIEDHRFAPLEWLYWREAQPRFDNVQTLIADLELRPERPELRAAPQAIDLDVLKRLSGMPAVTDLLRGPRTVERLWEAACLPDFRQLGAEPHSRFIASLWPHLATGYGHLPHAYAAQELARLDNLQGDIATLSQRIAAVRTWTYICHRSDWLSDPPAMADRAKQLEAKLSDALHDALRQRFVDKRLSKLMRGAAKDSALLPVVIDEANRVLVDGEDIGRLDGFAFKVDASAKAADHKLFLAAAQRHLALLLRQKAREVKMAGDSDFELGADAERQPAVYFQGDLIGHLIKGRSLMTPSFRPVKSVGALDAAALQDVQSRAEAWINAQLEKHLGGIVALHNVSQDAATDASVRALAVQLAEEGGIAGRAFLSDALRALPKEARGTARKSGIVFGALDVFHHAALKPAAAKWRAALFAARDERSMPEMPPESAVHLKDWNFANIADARNAGYRKLAGEYLRIDLAERVIKKAHEARGDQAVFGLDMTFATSLGLSDAGLNALMADAGFRKADAPAETGVDSEPAAPAGLPDPAPEETDSGGQKGESNVPGNEAEPISVTTEGSNTSEIVDQAQAADQTGDTSIDQLSLPATDSAPPLTYWRWAGMRKPQPRGQKLAQDAKRGHIKRKKSGPKTNRGKDSRAAPQPAKPAAPPSSLALQLAALQELHSPKKQK
ncbi:helicase-related protein [Sphingorhabdus arenilitoris]|uniref:Helicase-related protein n=1 Tax=Sphingorhabdus arenilitoris TaxID=1490041 RepID=A0ABV8RGI7_9SPHN